MAINKVTLNGETLIDLSKDTIVQNDAPQKIYHLPNGDQVNATKTPVYIEGKFTKNGIYLAHNQGVNGYDKIIVDVAGTGTITTTKRLSITPSSHLQTFVPLEGEAFSEVIVEPIPDNFVETYGSTIFTKNGTYNVKTLQTAEVRMGSTINEHSRLVKLLGL